MNSEALTFILYSFSIGILFLYSFNKHQLTVNNCLWIWCLFIIKKEFIVVIIVQFK
jgi:hypothetical protein